MLVYASMTVVTMVECQEPPSSHFPSAQLRENATPFGSHLLCAHSSRGGTHPVSGTLSLLWHRGACTRRRCARGRHAHSATRRPGRRRRQLIAWARAVTRRRATHVGTPFPGCCRHAPIGLHLVALYQFAGAHLMLPTGGFAGTAKQHLSTGAAARQQLLWPPQPSSSSSPAIVGAAGNIITPLFPPPPLVDMLARLPAPVLPPNRGRARAESPGSKVRERPKRRRLKHSVSCILCSFCQVPSPPHCAPSRVFTRARACSCHAVCRRGFRIDSTTGQSVRRRRRKG